MIFIATCEGRLSHDSGLQTSASNGGESIKGVRVIDEGQGLQ